MRYISLTQGKTAIVDDVDYELVSRYKWCANKGSRTWYAVRGVRSGGRLRRVYMHRFISQAPVDSVVDHVNHDTLDNRRENLRVGSQGLNLLNRFPNGGKRYKGVTLYYPNMRWLATFCGEHLGYWDTEVEAAKAYNARAYKENPDWALLNVIPGLTKAESLRAPHRVIRRRKSLYRGVRKRGRVWEATLQYKGERHTVGYFPTERLAGIMYNRKCLELKCPERLNYAGRR